MDAKRTRFSPSVVQAKALYAGLSALVKLANRRKNERTKFFCEAILRMWAQLGQQLKTVGPRTSEGVALLQNAEPNLRHLYLDIVWYSTEPYGNHEHKRVYSWRQGAIGPLNELINFAGAVLRELAVTRYPFPEPVFFQVREYRHDNVRILPHLEAERTPLDVVKKVYWRAGYKSSAKRPTYLLSHPTLPEMDFVDMIRAHVIELCRQCFIYNVPSADAHGYIRFLVHRLKPFLDWVYTGERTGRKDFWPDADKELRRLAREIRTLYGSNIGKRKRATEMLDEALLPQNACWLKTKATEVISATDDEEAKKQCARIAKMIDQAIIVDRDVTKLMGKMTTLIQKEGNDWHRVLFSGLHHPPSVRSVVFSGDTMLEKPGHIIVVAELPLVTPQGGGQVDLAFFVRRRVSGGAIWTPVTVLELKTRTSISFNFYSQESKSKRDMLPVPYLWKTTLSEKEWNEAVGSILPNTTLNQLDTYERGLLREYYALVPEDSAPPEFLQKGVILIDTHQSQSRVLRAFEELIDYLKANLQSPESKASGWVWYAPEARQDDLERPPRIAVVLCPSKRPSYSPNKVSPLDSVSVENPFQFRVKDDRHLALYIPVSSPAGFGRAAAWISMNWHLLNHLNDSIMASHSSPRIVWLDLLGDFPTTELVKARFGMETLNKKRKIAPIQYKDMRHLLRSIVFVRLDSEVAGCILSGKVPEFDAVKSEVKNASTGETVFVIGGWAEMAQLVPRHRQHLTAMMEDTLLGVLPKSNTSIIWTDESTPRTGMSSLYQCRCVRPLPYDSPRSSQIDEIIWNLPMAPRVTGGESPRRTDMRLIIHDTPTSAAPFSETILVPHLSDWARRFRGLSKGKKTVGKLEMLEATMVSIPMYNRLGLSSDSGLGPLSVTKEQAADMLGGAMTLIPSLGRPRAGAAVAEPMGSERPAWRVIGAKMSPRVGWPMSDRLHLRPELPPPQPSRSEKAYFELSKATRGWEYGSVPPPCEKSKDWRSFSRRPPLTGPTDQSAVDSLQTRRSELRRLLSAADFLRRVVSPKSDLQICCNDIVRSCRKALSVPAGENTLLEDLRDIKRLILSNTEREFAWRMLNQRRQNLADVLDSESRETLWKVVNANQDILSLYGNNLFLAVFAAAEKATEGTASQLMAQLWSAVAEWQLYQMGFKPQKTPGQKFVSRYDYQAIYSNLLRRANGMKNLPRHKPVQMIQRYGQALWEEQEDGYNIWLVFPERTTGRLLGALVMGQESLDLRLSWYRCMIDPERLSQAAETAQKSWNRMPIIVASLEEQEFLWMKTQEEEGEGWSCMGMLEYGAPPEARTFPIRWFKLSEPSPEAYSAIQHLRPGPEPSGLSESVKRLLKEVKAWEGTAKDVKCVVSIDVKQQVYRVEYRDATESDVEPFVVRTTPDTDEVVGWLKEPSMSGKYPVTDDGTLLRWDPIKDVEYGDIVIKRPRGKNEWVGTTCLKPLVHRRFFLLGCYVLPATCRELLETKEADDVTLVVKVNERLKKLGVKKHLTVVLDGLVKKSALHCIERSPLGIYDVALLAECEQLVDISMKTRHQLNIDVRDLRDVPLPPGIEEYERLSNAITEEIEESYEEASEESPLTKTTKVERPSGPELKLFGVEFGTRSKGYVLTVTAGFGETGDTEPSTGVVVIELLKETAKAHVLDYESVAGEVVERLSVLNVSDDTVSKTIEFAVEALRKEGIEISE